MDIYNFINSKDVKEYLIKSKYKFSLMEAAWLIYHNRYETFETKCKAWEELIINTKDQEYKDRIFDDNRYGFNSIHSMLKMYIELKRESFKIFKQKTENSVFTFDVYYLNEEVREDERTIFSDFDSLIEYVKTEKPTYIHSNYDKQNNRMIKRKSDFFDIHIEKHRLNDGVTLGCAFLDNNLCIKNIVSNEYELSEKDKYLSTELFDNCWFRFPIPFKKGDILVDPFFKKKDICRGPFVLNETCLDVYNDLREGHDSTDMDAYGYYINEDGRLYYEGNYNYVDLEYYRDEIKGVERILIPISNFLKGKIDLGLCVNAYHHIINEECVKKFKKSLHYTKVGFVDGGMENGENIHLKIWLDDERPAPEEYYHCHSVNETVRKILECERENIKIDVLDLDHDLGKYAKDGGDAIKLIDWLAENKKFYNIKIHTMNFVGRENMQREINRYWPNSN